MDISLSLYMLSTERNDDGIERRTERSNMDAELNPVDGIIKRKMSVVTVEM
jgi:hypothetical protein